MRKLTMLFALLLPIAVTGQESTRVLVDQDHDSCHLLLVETDGKLVPVVTSHTAGSVTAVVRVFYKAQMETAAATTDLLLSKTSLVECASPGIPCMGDPIADIAAKDVEMVNVKLFGQLAEAKFRMDHSK